MNLLSAEIAELDKGSARIGLFFRLDTTPAVRLWLGFGDIQSGVNVPDPAGDLYLGGGQIGALPELKQMVNGAAVRVDFTISGVGGHVLQIASGNDAQQVKGKRVAVGFAVMGDDWSLLGSVKWIQSYTADYLGLNQTVATEPSQSTTRTVTLSCGSLMTGRRRPSFSYFTAQDQRGRFPNDGFCDRTPLYANNYNKPWPRF